MVDLTPQERREMIDLFDIARGRLQQFYDAQQDALLAVVNWLKTGESENQQRDDKN